MLRGRREFPATTPTEHRKFILRFKRAYHAGAEHARRSTPGKLDGMDLAREVHYRWPSVLLVITKGQIRPARVEIPDDGRFVSKPYRTDDLFRTTERPTAKEIGVDYRQAPEGRGFPKIIGNDPELNGNNCPRSRHFLQTVLRPSSRRTPRRGLTVRELEQKAYHGPVQP